MREVTPYNMRGGAPWNAVRREVLTPGVECAIAAEGCTVVATQVDHIVSWRVGGAWFDLSNLRPACQHCNASAGAHFKQAMGWKLREDLTVIAYIGPIEELDDNLVLDKDTTVISFARMLQALGGNNPTSHMLAAAAYRTAIAKVRRGEVEEGYVVIHASTADAAQGLPHHYMVGPGAPRKDEHAEFGLIATA